MADPVPPDPPFLSGSEDQSRGQDFLVIGWTNTSDASKYEVFCNQTVHEYPSESSPFVTTFSGLAQNTEHELKVRCTYTGGDTIFSSSIVQFTRPKTPTFLLLAPPEDSSRHSDRLHLTWELIPGVPTYDLDRGGTLDSAVTWQVIGVGGGQPDQAAAWVESLAANTQYDFMVRARDDARGGASNWSDQAFSAFTRPPTPAIPRISSRTGQRIVISLTAVPTFPDSTGAHIQLGKAIAEEPTIHVVHDQPSLDPSQFDEHVSIPSLRLIYYSRTTVPRDGGLDVSFWSDPPVEIVPLYTAAGLSETVLRRRRLIEQSRVIQLLKDYHS